MDLDTRFSLDALDGMVGFHRVDRTLTISVSGELDASSIPDAMRVTVERLRSDDEVVAMDLSACTFCDSSGIMLLYKLHGLVTGAGGSFSLLDPTAQVRRLIEIVDQNGLLHLEPSAS